MCEHCTGDSSRRNIFIDSLTNEWYLDIETSEWDEYDDDWIHEKEYISYCPYCGRNLYEKREIMEWNVLFYDFNKNKLIRWNIFNNRRFTDSVKELLRTKNDKNDFSEKIRNELMYAFWSKREYEITISSLDFGSKDTVSKKIDIYNQVMLNFDKFVDYVWSFQEEIDG